MTVDSEKSARQRIVVTLDISETGRSALAVAVRLAAALNAELEGVFVEDTDLLDLAALPFLREIRAHSLVEEAVSAERMQWDLRALARQAERMLIEATAAMGVNFSFRVWRGHAALESLHEQLAADILSLSLAHAGRMRAQRWKPAVTRAAAGIGSVHVLLGAIGQADKTLDVAGRLAGSLGVPIRVLLPAGSRAPQVLGDKAAELPGARAQFIEFDGVAALAGALRAAGNTVLIAEAGDPLFAETGLGACLSTLACPILILR